MYLACRKHNEQELRRSRNTKRKGVDSRRAATSDDSSSESDEHHHRKAKTDRCQHRKHDRGDKHAIEVAASEVKLSNAHTSEGSSCTDSHSTKDRSDKRSRSESKYDDSKQTDRASRKHHESNRLETESRKRHKESDDVKIHTSSRDSELRSPGCAADMDAGNSKQNQAKTESDQYVVQSKTARQTVGTAFDNARARYLARKVKSSAPVVCEDSE